MPEKSIRFGFVLTPDEKAVLVRIASDDRISEGAVIRRLIWREGKDRQVLPEISAAENSARAKAFAQDWRRLHGA